MLLNSQYLHSIKFRHKIDKHIANQARQNADNFLTQTLTQFHVSSNSLEASMAILLFISALPSDPIRLAPRVSFVLGLRGFGLSSATRLCSAPRLCPVETTLSGEIRLQPQRVPRVYLSRTHTEHRIGAELAGGIDQKVSFRGSTRSRRRRIDFNFLSTSLISGWTPYVHANRITRPAHSCETAMRDGYMVFRDGIHNF